MSSLSLRLMAAMPDIFEKYSVADRYEYNRNHSKISGESDRNIGKYYGHEDYKLTTDIKTDYLSDPSPVSVDHISRPSPTMDCGSPRHDSSAQIPVKVAASYFVGTSSNELSSSYSESTLLRFAPPPLTRQRSMTLPDHNKLECYIALEPNVVYESLSYAELTALVERAEGGLQSGVVPILADGALGGTYFLRDKGKSICLVCKPGDEEPNAANNPHQKNVDVDRAYKGSITPGTGMYREVIAYLLDRGFAGVPATHLAKISHPSLHRSANLSAASTALNSASNDSQDSWRSVEERNRKMCSIQQYARHECCAEDLGSSQFSIADVQKLAVLDIMMINLDRHEGNVLVSRNNPFQRTIASSIENVITDVSATAAVFEAEDGSAVSATEKRGLKHTSSFASVISEAPAVSVPAPLPKTRLTTGPIVADSHALSCCSSDSDKVSLAASAPSAMSSLGNFFLAPIDCSSSATAATTAAAGNNSPRSTYASVTAGPSYVHPAPNPHRLIPIDHGFCLPHVLSIESANFCWLNWSQQINAPILPEVLQFIEDINTHQDIAIIKQTLGETTVSDAYLLSLHVGSSLLKYGVRAGLSLKDIGLLLTNESDEDESAVYQEDSYDQPARVQSAVNSALSALRTDLQSNSSVTSGSATEGETNNDKDNIGRETLLALAFQNTTTSASLLSQLEKQIQLLVEDVAAKKAKRESERRKP